jgi:hypothetical protein
MNITINVIKNVYFVIMNVSLKLDMQIIHYIIVRRSMFVRRLVNIVLNNVLKIHL